MNDRPLAEGWYLMSARDLEIELRRWRGGSGVEPSNAVALSSEDALSFRNAGNLPDGWGRSLRLVLIVSSAEDLGRLDQKRLSFEPDAHDAPKWRREGSRPINVVPLRTAGVASSSLRSWEDDPDMAALEEEWSRTGTVRGIGVDAEVRGFVYKTVVALERDGREVTVSSITASLERWLDVVDVERVRAGLRD